MDCAQVAFKSAAQRNSFKELQATDHHTFTTEQNDTAPCTIIGTHTKHVKNNNSNMDL